MGYKKEFKLECIRKYKTGENIDDPGGCKHETFHNNVRMCKRFHDVRVYVYGELTYDNNSVFGINLVKAYDLEEGHMQPIVALDKELKKKYEEYKLFESDLLSPFSFFIKRIVSKMHEYMQLVFKEW